MRAKLNTLILMCLICLILSYKADLNSKDVFTTSTLDALKKDLVEKNGEGLRYQPIDIFNVKSIRGFIFHIIVAAIKNDGSLTLLIAKAFTGLDRNGKFGTSSLVYNSVKSINDQFIERYKKMFNRGEIVKSLNAYIGEIETKFGRGIEIKYVVIDFEVKGEKHWAIASEKIRGKPEILSIMPQVTPKA